MVVIMHNASLRELTFNSLKCTLFTKNIKCLNKHKQPPASVRMKLFVTGYT